MYLSHGSQVRILLTNNCNLNCLHCYQGGEKRGISLSWEQLQKIVTYLKKEEVDTVVLSGGEVFVYNRIYELLDLLLTDCGFRILIVTNGTVIDTGFFERNRNFRDRITFQFSIDGSEKNHDLRRGCGTYSKAIKNAEVLSASGYIIKANMAVDETNWRDMVTLINDRRFSSVSFIPVANLGNARKTGGRNSGSYDSSIIRLYRETEAGNLSSPFFPDVLAISFDGNVYPSFPAQDFHVLNMGNITSEPIERIVSEYIGSDQYRRICSRENYICNSCEKFNECRGGSRERAYRAFSDVWAVDPLCCRLFLDEYRDIPLSSLFCGEILE